MDLRPSLQRQNPPRPDRGEHRSVDATRRPVTFTLSRNRLRKVDPRVHLARYADSRFVITYSARPPLADAGTPRTMIVTGKAACDAARAAMHGHGYDVLAVRVKGIFG